MANTTNDRLKWITHKETRILLHDFSGLRDEEFARQVSRNEQDIIKLGETGEKDLLILTDFSDSVIYPAVMEALKQLALSAKPYVRASAVIGMPDSRRMLLDVVRNFAGRDITRFDSREEALDWLVKHADS